MWHASRWRKGGRGVTHSDVIVALFGVSAGLAGLVLVFLGLAITTVQSFHATTPVNVVAPYRKACGFVLAAFLVGVACVGAATAWLLTRDNDALYVATAILFGVQLAALVASTVWVARALVWARS